MKLDQFSFDLIWINIFLTASEKIHDKAFECSPSFSFHTVDNTIAVSSAYKMNKSGPQKLLWGMPYGNSSRRIFKTVLVVYVEKDSFGTTSY